MTVAAAASFQVIAPAHVKSGRTFDLTVIAVDAYGNIDTHYTGTVNFSTSDPDPGVQPPSDYTFTAADAGMATFVRAARLFTPGDQTLTVTDAVAGFSGSAPIRVKSQPQPFITRDQLFAAGDVEEWDAPALALLPSEAGKRSRLFLDQTPAHSGGQVFHEDSSSYNANF